MRTNKTYLFFRKCNSTKMWLLKIQDYRLHFNHTLSKKQYNIINIYYSRFLNFGKVWKSLTFPENSGISGNSGNFQKIREFRKIPEKISGISGKTFFGNLQNYKKFGQLFGKSRCFYKNRFAQQCTHRKN